MAPKRHFPPAMGCVFAMPGQTGQNRKEPFVPECCGPGLVSSWVVKLRVTPSQLEWDVSSTLLSYVVSWSSISQHSGVGLFALVLEPTNWTKFLSIQSLLDLASMRGGKGVERI